MSRWKRYIVSPYTPQETMNRIVRPGAYDECALYPGELLSFNDEAWARFYAERAGAHMFEDMDVKRTDAYGRGLVRYIDRRCAPQTLAYVFGNIVDDEFVWLLGGCLSEGLSPDEYLECIPHIDDLGIEGLDN